MVNTTNYHTCKYKINVKNIALKEVNHIFCYSILKVYLQHSRVPELCFHALTIQKYVTNQSTGRDLGRQSENRPTMSWCGESKCWNQFQNNCNIYKLKLQIQLFSALWFIVEDSCHCKKRNNTITCNNHVISIQLWCQLGRSWCKWSMGFQEK